MVCLLFPDQFGKPSPPYTAWKKGECKIEFTGTTEYIPFRTVGSYGKKILKLLLENENTLGFKVEWRYGILTKNFSFSFNIITLMTRYVLIEATQNDLASSINEMDNKFPSKIQKFF